MKSQFLRIVENKLSMLEESKITDLMLKGNYEEAKVILEQIEYYSLLGYLKDEHFEKLEVWEIPKLYKLTFVWYLWGSGHKAKEIMANVEEWKKDLVEYTKTYEVGQAEVIQTIVNEVIQ